MRNAIDRTSCNKGVLDLMLTLVTTVPVLSSTCLFVTGYCLLLSRSLLPLIRLLPILGYPIQTTLQLLFTAARQSTLLDRLQTDAHLAILDDHPFS